jgi:hypothetical protein
MESSPGAILFVDIAGRAMTAWINYREGAVDVIEEHGFPAMPGDSEYVTVKEGR